MQDTADPTKKIVVPLVLRSDTASGLSSIQQAINAITTEGVQFTIIKSSVGDITEEDVRLALAQEGGEVLGFHTQADQRARQMAERNDATIHLFPTIYEVTQWTTELATQKQTGYELQNPTGEAKIIRMFEEQESQNTYVVGAQIHNGSFSVGQKIAVTGTKADTNQFTIESIEQKNAAQETVAGEKTQFAMRINGAGTNSTTPSWRCRCHNQSMQKKPFREGRANTMLHQTITAFLREIAHTDPIITVSYIDLNKTGTTVTVYYSVFPEEKKKAVHAFLKRNEPQCRTYVKKHTTLRIAPTVRFSPVKIIPH